MLLIPPYLVWTRIARPFIAFYNDDLATPAAM
jgi:hypothetical protein